MIDRIVGEIIAAAGGRSLAVSRAAHPDLIKRLRSITEIAVLPISGGRTIWAATPPNTFVTVDTPNYLGITEPPPSVPHFITVVRIAGMELVGRLIDATTPQTIAPRDVQRLQKRLASCGGVVSYHRRVAAPWFTILASNPDVLTQPAIPEVAAAVLGPDFADVPGGVRIAVGPDASTRDLGRYAAAVEEVIAAKDDATG